jgi:septal ring factor EnvC (AmiA/AmiB activator)
MNRTKAIIVSVSLTGIILAAILALGFRSTVINPSDPAGQQTTTPEVTPNDKNIAELQQEIEAWQQHSQQLEQTVLIMQQREVQYQQQLASANQTIVQLQNQLNSGNTLRQFPFGGEREGFEFGGFDD